MPTNNTSHDPGPPPHHHHSAPPPQVVNTHHEILAGTTMTSAIELRDISPPSSSSSTMMVDPSTTTLSTITINDGSGSGSSSTDNDNGSSSPNNVNMSHSTSHPNMFYSSSRDSIDIQTENGGGGGNGRRSLSLDMLWRPSVELLDRNAREAYARAVRFGQTASDDGHGKGSGIFGTSANFANSILGVGIVGMPYALRESGLISGVILLVLMACVTDWSIGLLISTSHAVSAKTYPELCEKAFGFFGRFATAFFMWFLTFVGSVGYTIIVGDSLPAVWKYLLSHVTSYGMMALADTPWWYQVLVNRTFWIVVAIVFIIGPLSMLENIGKLESFSFLSIVSEIILLGVVIVEAILIFVRAKQGKPEPGDVTSLPSSFTLLFLSPNVFGAIGVFSMAFSSHHNSHLLYGAMKNASPQRFRYSTHMSMFLSALVLLVLATTGFLAYQDTTAGNILNNLPGDSIQGNIARFAISLTMFFTMPLEMFVCKTAATDLLKNTVLRKFSLPEDSRIKERHLVKLLTAFMLAIVTVLAILIKNLGSVLELAGGFGAVSLAYILPSLCFLRLTPGKWYAREKIPALLLCIVGVFCFSTSTPFNIYNMIAGSH